MHDYEDTLHKVLNQVYRNTDDCEMRISEGCYKLIREALEKQIPKKPIRTNYIVKVNGIDTLLDENEFTKCPSCTYKDVKVKQGQKHCHICGQALDWSGDCQQLVCER